MTDDQDVEHSLRLREQAEPPSAPDFALSGLGSVERRSHRAAEPATDATRDDPAGDPEQVTAQVADVELLSTVGDDVDVDVEVDPDVEGEPEPESDVDSDAVDAAVDLDVEPEDEPHPGVEPDVETAANEALVTAFAAEPIVAREPVIESAVERPRLSPELVELAEAHGVATEFWDWQGQHTTVPQETVLAVLAGLDVDASSPEAVQASLALEQDRLWRQVLPDVVVVREGVKHQFATHVPHGSDVSVWIYCEDGETRYELTPDAGAPETREIDGRTIGKVSFTVPQDLPLGWHTIVAANLAEEFTVPLVVTPQRLEVPPAVDTYRAWGFMTQLYSVRSQYSWGLGDLSDLNELAAWSARDHGADFVLVNPMHATAPVPPMEPSPYLPSSRRFFNPLYLRVEAIPEVAYMPSTDRALIEWQAEAMRGFNTDPGELDRDVVWEAKRSALEVVYAQPRPRGRQASFEIFCDREGDGLLDFATWCALSERYGAQTSTWPEHARDVRSTSVEELRQELADRVQFYMWLQWCLDEQLADAQRVARDAGMEVGIIHDLAVGVHPEGSDLWAMSDVLAGDVSVGAPPDAFNQQGQNWNQPPWRPDRLRELGYAPYRDMLRTVLRHSGALRVDHIIGLFRLWWIPRGADPTAGTYVRYDEEALIGILALEAHRAGAFVIGEDLGTVEPSARDYLRERGILGTSILWFERRDGERLPPQAWRELCLATVTTHDLPPTAGYLAGEHVALRTRLGLLTRDPAEELAIDEADRAAVLDQLRELGLLAEKANEREQVEALYRFLTWTPAKLIGIALADAVGDRRAINQPGTHNEYPNWRLPMADSSGRPVLLEDVMTAQRAISLTRAVNGR